MSDLLRGFAWAILWLACGVGGFVLLSMGCIFGLWALAVWLLTGLDGAAKAIGK